MYHIVIQQAGAHACLAMSKSHRSAGASMNTRPGHLSGGDALIGKQPRRVSPPQRRKKVRSFSPATCAAEKIPLGLQTCALAAKSRQRVRCSQAANLFSKKQYFFDRKRPRTVLGSGALVHPSVIHAARQHALCFCRRLRQSAIMAMNSEFVGLPLMFETV